MNIKTIGLFLISIATSCYSMQSEPAILPFEADRDMPVVEKVLGAYPQELTYEYRGYEAGTTKKYIMSPNYTTKVLRVDDETVGFINYTIIKPPFLLNWFMSPQGLIHLMGVDKEHQKKGYGRILFHYALEELKNKNLPSVCLSVCRENKGARSFYEKEGFHCGIPESMQSYFADLMYEKKF